MIGMNIKYLRTKFGMTQEELAEKLGVSRQTVAKWECGESLPDVRKCADMSVLFDVSIDAMASMPLDEQKDTEDYKDGKNVFGIVKVGERGQIVIPKQARLIYDIKSGDSLLVVGDQRGMALAKIRNFTDFSFGG